VTAAYHFGHFELRTATRQLLIDQEPAPLGARAFDVLVALIERRDRSVSKDELLDLVWPGVVVEENNLQVQVSALRKILGQEAIATIPGRGYRFTVALTSGATDAPGLSARGTDPTPAVPPPKALSASIDETAQSIAVLPFVNISDDAANEYFADGIAEELLNVLSKIQGLRVASRTSAFGFKGSKADIPTVAQKLNVSTILEGSVRKFGNRVRITAQLVHVPSDSHMWSETYDRDLEDIFAIQDDIAQSVVRGLRSTLFGKALDSSASAALTAEVQAASKGRGQNPEAFRLLLHGRFLVARRTREDTAKAIAYLRRAIELDPEYALAWAELAYVQSVEAFTGWVERAAGYSRVREAAERALALEPDLAEGHVALANVRMQHDWDWRGAEAAARRALRLAPGNAEIMLAAGWTLGSLGDLEESIILFRRAIALDPLNGLGHRYVGYFSLYAGLLEQAEAALKESLEINPLGAFTRSHLGQVCLIQGRLAEAFAAFAEEPHEGYRLLGLSVAHHALGREAASSEALDQLSEQPVNAFLIAQANAYRGNADLAFQWLERAHAQRNAVLCHVKLEPFLRSLHRDSRWPLFLNKMGLAV